MYIKGNQGLHFMLIIFKGDIPYILTFVLSDELTQVSKYKKWYKLWCVFQTAALKLNLKILTSSQMGYVYSSENFVSCYQIGSNNCSEIKILAGHC
jgi:hypothetical protein